MAENSKIEWTDHTFNPWVGCTKVSPGCDHCYAEQLMDKRMHVVQWGTGQPRKRTSEANWRQPLRWNAQAEREGRRFRVFCASLADVFDNEVPAAWRHELFALIDDTQHLDWLLLTKRIGNARAMLDDVSNDLALRETGAPWPPRPNVWIGASIVNQAEADRDIPRLLAVPAARRFLSMEPLLGPVDLTSIARTGGAGLLRPLDGRFRTIDWVIVGGESGPHARPMHPAWATGLRDQCNAAGVPFFFKQWGEWSPEIAGNAVTASHRWPICADQPEAVVYRTGKKAAGRLLDGRTWDEVPAPMQLGTKRALAGRGEEVQIMGEVR